MSSLPIALRWDNLTICASTHSPLCATSPSRKTIEHQYGRMKLHGTQSCRRVSLCLPSQFPLESSDLQGAAMGPPDKLRIDALCTLCTLASEPSIRMEMWDHGPTNYALVQNANIGQPDALRLLSLGGSRASLEPNPNHRCTPKPRLINLCCIAGTQVS